MGKAQCAAYVECRVGGVGPNPRVFLIDRHALRPEAGLLPVVLLWSMIEARGKQAWNLRVQRSLSPEPSIQPLQPTLSSPYIYIAQA